MSLPQLDGYKIKKEFASGGMARIYDATQVSLNRPVAIKFLSEQLISHSEAKALFESESLIIAQLHHPNIVQVIDKGISQSRQPYFVMEKVKGIDLSQMLAQGQLPFGKKLDIAIQLCKGLAYAHRNGVIHRDIKPSNIIIDQHGDVKILDFGIALAKSDAQSNLATSAVVGTQGYIAPEQQNDYSNATIASDIYSVGIVFIDLFGSPAKGGKKASLSRLTGELPAALKELIVQCCHDKPDQRYPSLSQVRDQLLKISQGSHLSQTSIKELQQENKDLANSFNLLDVLSKTAAKRVYLFQKKSNRQLLVIKRSIGDLAGLREAKYLTSLRHPNIANIFAAVKNNGNMTLISEYLSGGSLSNQLIQDLSEEDFLRQAHQICSALYFAHQNNILHSNLSPNNILLDAKQNLKLCDFGQTTNSNDDPRAARAYQPPAQQGYCEQYDIYCMGAIFYHMLFGVPPNSISPTAERRVSFRLQRLIDAMLSIDPLNRPGSAQQVLIELTRIANASNVRMKSNMGVGEEPEYKPKKRPSKKKNTARKGRDHTLWLSIALIISILCIIGLIAKDFV